MARDGQPNMTRICLHALAINSVFKTIKSTGYINLLTQTKTTLIIPFRTLTDLSTSKRIVKVSFNSLRLSFQYPSKEAS